MEDSWEVLPKGDQDRMMKEGGYLDISIMSVYKFDPIMNSVYDSTLEGMLALGEKLETLDTCGNVLHHTLTGYLGQAGPHWGCITRHESGRSKGEEFYLGSSFFERHCIGIKVLAEFPWEKDEITQSQ